ncbi:unnamed protein product [marine sediment metagenome]|uniref:HEAT repeat domain-containing protein n=1 Tax=marine sediment metagenome TaxID=412755 RepID=X0UV76_9ZZZZ
MRWAAATALGELKDSRAMGPLTAALEDEAEGVRQAASVALEKIEESADDAL